MTQVAAVKLKLSWWGAGPTRPQFRYATASSVFLIGEQSDETNTETYSHPRMCLVLTCTAKSLFSDATNLIYITT